MDKKQARLRRGQRTRLKIRELGMHRLCVHRTPQHIYAQIIDPTGAHTLVTASTLEKAIREKLAKTTNVEAAKAVGLALAEKAKAAGIERVAFDRSGFKYHGRVKALADGAREGGIQF